jgi:NAD(P)H-hydrate repair Nnr-like enzyme with NAD(P)H-hydrate epimerase domain
MRIDNLFGSGPSGRINIELTKAIDKINRVQLSQKKGSEAYKLNQEVIDILAKIILLDDKIYHLLNENI